MEFPPVNTTGNYRSAGFARYLNKKGVIPIILTAEEKSAEKTFNKNADNSLLKGLEKVKIYRFPIKPINKLYSSKIGNYFRIWWNYVDSIDSRWYYGENKKEIHKIIKKEKPDLLYVSLPPFSMAKTAIKISKEFEIPLITDMRDAWSLWGSSPFSTRLHFKLVKNLEAKLFNQSKYIIATSPEMGYDFKKNHPSIKKDKFKVIFNGYDNFEIENDILDIPPFVTNTDSFTIGYVGSFYYDPKIEDMMEIPWYKRRGLQKFYFSPRKEFWKYRSPYFFLKSLQLLIENRPELSDKIKFEYIGKAPNWLPLMIDEMQLTNNFIDHGFCNKMEVLRIQSSWDAILATSEKIIDGNHYTVPSKSFDSIKSKKKIFAYLTPGSQLNFLKAYSQVEIFSPDEITKNAQKLERDITERCETTMDELSPEFTRESQSEKLLDLIS